MSINNLWVIFTSMCLVGVTWVLIIYCRWAKPSINTVMMKSHIKLCLTVAPETWRHKSLKYSIFGLTEIQYLEEFKNVSVSLRLPAQNAVHRNLPSFEFSHICLFQKLVNRTLKKTANLLWWCQFKSNTAIPRETMLNAMYGCGLAETGWSYSSTQCVLW